MGEIEVKRDSNAYSASQYLMHAEYALKRKHPKTATSYTDSAQRNLDQCESIPDTNALAFQVLQMRKKIREYREALKKEKIEA